MEMVCITCPNGCRLLVSREGDAITVTGNSCPRGVEFAKAELTHPTRSLTTTVRTISREMPVLPVRTDGELPKELIPEAMKALRRVLVKMPLACGDTVVENLLDTGVCVIATCHFIP